MRHRKGNKTLTVDTNYTETLLYNMTLSLVEHKRIKTTLVKAKALRSYVEKLVTIARKPDEANSNFRLLTKKLRANTKLVSDLKEVAEAYTDRPGGYTRVLKAGYRYGDAAAMAVIELVDRDEDARGLDSGPVQNITESPDEPKEAVAS